MESGSQCSHDLEEVFDNVERMTGHEWFGRSGSMFKRMIARVAIWIANSARIPDTPRPSTKQHVAARAGGADGSGGGGWLHSREAQQHQEDRCSMEEDDIGTVSDAHNGSQAVSDRPFDDPPGDRRARGDERGHQEGQEHEEEEQCGHRAGHRRAIEQVQSTPGISDQSSSVQSPGGCSEVPGKSMERLVDMHEMWSEMGPSEGGRHECHHDTKQGGRERRGPEAQDRPQGVSQVPAGAKRTTRTGGSGGEPGPPGSTSNREKRCVKFHEHEYHDRVPAWAQCFFSSGEQSETTETTSRTTTGATLEDTDTEFPAGSVRDGPIGRRVERCRDGGKTGRNQRGQSKRILVQAEELRRCPQLAAKKLVHRLVERGWMLKAILVMISLSQSPGPPMPWILSGPSDELVWSHATNQWESSEKNDCATTTSTSGQEEDYNMKSSEKDCATATSTSGLGSIWCYVYPQSSIRSECLSDATGKIQCLQRKDITEIKESVQAKWDVAEVYSPPRVTKRAQRMGLAPGLAMDFSTGWDFSLPLHRKEALKLIHQHRPGLVMLSPPCGPFSTMRRLTTFKRDPAVVKKEVQQGTQHVEFSVRIAEIQMKAGRGFLFEHPRYADSWKGESLGRLRQHRDVFSVMVDMCQFGLKSKQGEPVLKPTILLTNVKEIAERMAKTCPRLHAHASLEGNQATRHAAIYTDIFVDEILKGLRRHLQVRHFPVFGCSDHWQRTPTALLCRHFQTRRALCVPQECEVFEVSEMSFTGHRRTTQMLVDGQTRHLQDDWRHAAAVATAQPWTGLTVFEIAPEIIVPGFILQAAQEFSKAAAHDMYHYQLSESSFQSEWWLLHHISDAAIHAFPSHRILEGRDTGRASSSSRLRSLEEIVEEDLLGSDEDKEDAGGVKYDAKDEDEQQVGSELREELQRLEQGERDRGPELREVVPPDVRREVYRIHRNLGHPNLQTFLRALRHSGIKRSILRWVKREFLCPICEARKQPQSHRPAHLSRRLDFNEVVGVDLFYVKKHAMLNVLCWGTSLQWVEALSDKSAETVTRAFMKSWCGHYGAPRMLVADQGGEFTGAFFVQTVSDAGTLIHYTDVKSPWQNSRTERAGGIFKQKLQTTIDEAGIVDETELDIAIAETLWTRNQYFDRSGFSPFQRVFGATPRIPMNLLSDDMIDRELLQSPQSDSMQRTLVIREVARKAWMRQQDAEAVSRASRANTRRADVKPVCTGDMVYVWRATSDYTGWSGPGMVVAESSNGRSLWISLRGYLIKASREQVRLATSEERLGAEVAAVVAPQMLEKLEAGVLRHFNDIENEGGPLAEPQGIEEMDYEPSVTSEKENEAAASPLSSTVDDVAMEESAIPKENIAPREELPQDAEERADTSGEGASTREPLSSVPEGGPTPTASRRSSIRVDEASSGSFPFGPMRPERGGHRATPMPFPFSSPPASWPPAHSASNFVEMANEEKVDHDGVNLKYDRLRSKWIPREAAKNQETFEAVDAQALYSHRDRFFYLTKKKESPGQVTFTKLSHEETKIFRASREKEIKIAAGFRSGHDSECRREQALPERTP